jgi:hypothetical protein
MKDLEPVADIKKGRRKLLWGIGILSFLPLLKLGFFSRKRDIISCAPPPSQPTTMKYLTEDGKLVEVDISKINSIQQKISNEELKDWVKR